MMSGKEHPVASQVEALRQNLLDLTMRNNLLNFRPSKQRTIHIIDEVPREIYDILVLQEKSMRFLEYKPENDGETIENPFCEPFEKCWMPLKPDAIDINHIDNKFQTTLNKSELQMKLKYVHRQSKSIFDEQGYSVLFLALGFLKWKENETSDKFRHSPLILIPVELVRPEVRSQYTLKWTGEDIFSNISLQTKLVEQGVAIPDFEMADNKMDIDNYYAKVARAISEQDSWKVLNDVFLGFFSFTKFVMYKDLNPVSWGLKDFSGNPLFNSLFSTVEKDPAEFEGGFSESDVDTLLRVSDMHHIVNADPSQISVIEDVKAGRNLVVQGPPGTGKSQTIMNMIGELLIAGKSVLFVSEKMAALEVVKRRLDSVGLGTFCLELHSRKSKRKDVLREIENTINREPPSNISLNEQINRLEALRGELNAYARVLREPVGSSERSLYSLFSLREGVMGHFESVGREMPRFDMRKVEKFDPESVFAAERSLEDITLILKPLVPIAKHPWYGVGIETVLPADIEKISKQIKGIATDSEILQDMLDELEGEWGLFRPETFNETHILLGVRAFLQSYPNGISSDSVFDEKWNDRDKVEGLIGKISEFQKIVNVIPFSQREVKVKTENVVDDDISSLIDESAEFRKMCHRYRLLFNTLETEWGIWHPETIDDLEKVLSLEPFIKTYPREISASDVIFNIERNPEVAKNLIGRIGGYQQTLKELPFDESIMMGKCSKEDINTFLNKGRKFFSFLSGDFRRLKKEILSYCHDRPKKVSDAFPDFEKLMMCMELKENIEKCGGLGEKLFGEEWKFEKSNTKKLENINRWTTQFGSLVKSGLVSVGTAKRIYSEREESNSFEIFEKLELVATDTKKLIELFTIAGVFEKPVRTFKDLERAIAQLVLCKSLKEEILASELEGKKIFGTNWQNENSYVSVFKEISEWVYKYRQMAEQKKVTPRTIMKLDRVRGMDGGYDIFDEFSSSITRLEMSLGTLMDNLKTESEIIYDKSPDEVPFKHWLSKLDVWNKNTDRLVEWSDYYRRRTACAKTNALPLIDLIERDEIVAEDIVPCYQGNYADILLKYAFEFHPELANFNVNLHEKKVREFAELDGKMILWNREKIVADIYQSRPRLHGGASSNSSVGVILREVNRKRRHMPIRKLITATSDILLKIKPCFMMSPISVAQFLEPNCVKFDVVIFDEASQVKPEDALGAIARGTQLVVLGDTRQLPPTNFFDSIIDSDVEFEDEIDMGASDMESILHLCKKSYPTKTLNWHYRSRHESLIEVSNQEFYDNRLLIYPSPDYESDRLGLKFVHLPDAIYDRGISSINRLEAQEVAKFAIAHYRKNPDKSLGIGTFNIRQQQAIRDEIERLLEQDPNVEYSLYANEAEPFFVKNLETIQGDERDIILLSIGFGFDSTRKLSLNFGPLNQDGGERRLNVLITRAREKCVVFSNFKAKDLLIAASSPFGLRALKTFLQYAEDRNLIQNRPSGGDADSPFEEGVYECLRDEGFYVHKQVGCARYRIDMAIIDPDSPGRYVLGIECDGVTYHSSRVARERDRLRRQVLEGLGWRLYRVWSTDWYRNRKNAQDRLLKAVKTAVENKDCIISHVLEKGETKELVAEPQRKDNHTNGLTEEELFDSYSEVSNYKICTSIGISTWQELHEISPSDLSTVVSKIVQVEGPVHVDEVIRRIREHWDLKRSGSRIQNNVHNAIMIASRRGSVTKKGNFLYCPTDSTIRVRRRNDNLQLKIEQISDEEITEAVILVLRHQFSTPQNELAVPVSRLFGFKSTSSQIAEYIDRVVTKMLRMNHLTKNANGLIALKEQKNQLLMPSRPSCLESSFFIQFETVNR